jgi:DMSO/TMAO reductase YedYZ molybdopterin-dependent catalytic subunit
MRRTLGGFLDRQRRRWPSFWRRLHLFGILASLAAILTGIAIVWPYAHAHLIAYLLSLRIVHTVLGVSVALALGIGAGRAFPHRRNRLDWVPTAVILGALTTSGVVLLVPTSVPAAWAAAALPIHLWATWAFVAWAAFHVVRKLHIVTVREVPYLEERRSFLAAAARFFGAGALVSVFGPTLWNLLTTGTTGSWQIYSITGTFPDVPPDRYRLGVAGLVERPAVLSLDELEALPATSYRRNFHCVTGWVVEDVAWQGVLVDTLVQRFGPLPEARYVVFYSADGRYVDSLTLAEARTTEAMLAYRMDGQPLDVPHGGPVRLFVPQMYGYKSVKWVNRVELMAFPPLGTWEAYGYPANAWIDGSA